MPAALGLHPTAIKPVVSATAEVLAIYSADGTQVRELQPGLNIVKTQDGQGNIITKKVIR